MYHNENQLIICISFLLIIKIIFLRPEAAIFSKTLQFFLETIQGTQRCIVEKIIEF